ncbi:MAG: 4-(cytidine 5'-diphospho)-2-C-methyl-D-erythritol kinase [Candidatus Omnitrophica bacterium CG11_big_fil_rev_8_21_14_0_20_63_9]|nr:MAG: 4-(cytidine 5'-diphospho)-2-C-methyl-D-erythritol kinase [Candidatus Omnitrophica bacterium CG11_big_fil_rev_8_21_14_0_20_63_9]
MIRLRAPAKLNLYLAILGKRPDGFHELETVFERVDLADELTFEPQPSGLTLTCTDPALSCGQDNLIMKAANALQRASSVSQGARIRLRKRIPVAAGLGGGSSDAACTLLGLNELWKLRWERSQLAKLAAQLGSDVPFFLLETPFAIGRGRGERLEPLADAKPLTQVLVVPDAQLSTKDVYAGFDRRHLTAGPSSISMVAHALRNGPALAGLADGLRNDLEPEAIQRCPVIARIREQLKVAGCLASRLSGSGPAVFGLCRDQRNAQAIVSTLRQRAPSSWRIEIIQTDRPSSLQSRGGTGWRSPRSGSRSVRSSPVPLQAAQGRKPAIPGRLEKSG